MKEQGISSERLMHPVGSGGRWVGLFYAKYQLVRGYYRGGSRTLE